MFLIENMQSGDQFAAKELGRLPSKAKVASEFTVS